ncbi:C-terminal processing peptidase [Butyrivibrio proteoclasticus B316]|uniref:C-terminal processing peptidase n=1 Tax=Butyrivibrio proteoclasticus (strain ATCC 51982 / DSM 14932 / B316) TaxID=515622 RepID=E0RY77_BUTPB|nr:S41 family peptidase [Butyrivibrio proteoclasticus]ADL35335.1 C-terminal processing peptidase [Butyrivibrio proteoclasticus B316]
MDSNNGLNQITEPVVEVPNAQGTRAYDGRLTRRFIAGILIGFLVSVLVVSAAVLSLLYVYKGNGVPGLSVTGESDLLNEDTLNKIQALEDVIDTYYYKTDVDKQDEADGIYKGLMNSLGDPYSVYYTEEELDEMMNSTKGIYYGIGAYVSFDNTINMARISGVMPGSPAESAELCVDDIIYEINKESTQGLTLEEVVSLIKGEAGTTVHLTLVRNGSTSNVEVDVERAQIEVPTVSSEVFDNNVGYLKITEFDEVTYSQFVENMAELRAQNIEGLIIDLRSNPGGNLSTVCDIARQLLPKGVIVYTEDREGNREDYTCDGQNEIDIPVVVLVNQYSASASEILAGAIKDYNLGKLVGKTTYGKGIVQRIFDLRDGTAVKLTVSSYFTPNGINIHGVGIEPDVEVEYDGEAYAKDKTDTQLDKAKEVMQELLDK